MIHLYTCRRGVFRSADKDDIIQKACCWESIPESLLDWCLQTWFLMTLMGWRSQLHRRRYWNDMRLGIQFRCCIEMRIREEREGTAKIVSELDMNLLIRSPWCDLRSDLRGVAICFIYHVRTGDRSGPLLVWGTSLRLWNLQRRDGRRPVSEHLRW